MEHQFVQSLCEG